MLEILVKPKLPLFKSVVSLLDFKVTLPGKENSVTFAALIFRPIPSTVTHCSH